MLILQIIQKTYEKLNKIQYVHNETAESLKIEDYAKNIFEI